MADANKVVNTGAADTSWSIEGKGEKPSLTFTLNRDAQLDSESNKALGVERWTKDDSQPKHQYIIEVTHESWDELFKQAKISTGWVIGKMCREGEFVSNAHKDENGKVKLNQGAETIKVALSSKRKTKVVKSAQQQFAEMNPDDRNAAIKALIEQGLIDPKVLGLSA